MASDRIRIYRHLYKRLLALYPPAFREELGESMEQTFADLCNERRQSSGRLLGFVVWAYAETSVGIVRENLTLSPIRSLFDNPHLAALLGLLSVAPFVAMNAIVANQVEPFISILRPDTHTNFIEQVMLFLLTLVLPLGGAFVAIRPSLRTGSDGTRKLYLHGTFVAMILTVGAVMVAIAIGAEMYQCDVLKVPNCD